MISTLGVLLRMTGDWHVAKPRDGNTNTGLHTSVDLKTVVKDIIHLRKENPRELGARFLIKAPFEVCSGGSWCVIVYVRGKTERVFCVCFTDTCLVVWLCHCNSMQQQIHSVTVIYRKKKNKKTRLHLFNQLLIMLLPIRSVLQATQYTLFPA